MKLQQKPIDSASNDIFLLFDFCKSVNEKRKNENQIQTFIMVYKTNTENKFN